MSRLYVLVRRDLPPAWQPVQACHAAFEAGQHFSPEHHPRMVLLGVDGEPDLLFWQARLADVGIRSRAFHEPYRNTGFTALATEALEEEGASHLAALPLL